MLTMICASGAAPALAQSNLLLNGNLTKGSGNSPDGWRTAVWKNGSDFTAFRWHHARDVPSEIEISSIKPNDAYWAQTIRLAPGWYHFTANIRTEGVATNATGANLSILEDGIISPQLNGTTDWTTVGFYLKVSQRVTDLVLACRLGGFAGLNTGTVFCRDIAAVAILEPPSNADHRYDLDSIRGEPNSSSPASAARTLSLMWGVLGAIATLLFARLFWVRRPAATPGNGPGVPAPRTSAHPESTAAVATGSPRPLELDRARAGVAHGEMDRVAVIAVALAVALVAWLAIRRLDGTPYSINFGAALTGLRTVLPVTGIAALKLWSFWGLSAMVIAGLSLQIDPTLDLLDAVLAGASGVWVVAYLLGQLLGPIRLFRPVTIWLLLAAGIIQLYRKPPRLPPLAASAGQKLTMISFGLLAIGLMPLQFGSPLAPYMDVLSYPASVQRILSVSYTHLTLPTICSV